MLETRELPVTDPTEEAPRTETEEPLSHKEKFIGDLIQFQLRSEANHDIYEPRLTAEPPVDGFGYVPRCIYFYYVRLDGNGMVRIVPYFYANGPVENSAEWQPIPYAEVADPEGIVKRLALNARPSTTSKNPDRMPGKGFSDKWRRRSYIVIFFDESNWSFHQRIGGKSSVVFNISENHKPNRSFFDARDLDVYMPRRRGGEDKRTAIFFVNHMKDADSGGDFDDRPDQRQEYKFDMYMRARYADDATGTVTVILDPTGTNQGPPETP